MSNVAFAVRCCEDLYDRFMPSALRYIEVLFRGVPKQNLMRALRQLFFMTDVGKHTVAQPSKARRLPRTGEMALTAKPTMSTAINVACRAGGLGSKADLAPRGVMMRDKATTKARVVATSSCFRFCSLFL